MPTRVAQGRMNRPVARARVFEGRTIGRFWSDSARSGLKWRLSRLGFAINGTDPRPRSCTVLPGLAFDMIAIRYAKPGRRAA
jgi:hypothetical protein